MAPFKDALLALSTYPDPTPRPVIDQAIDLASRLGAKLAALAPVLEDPKSFPGGGDWLFRMPLLMDNICRESRTNADELLRHFEDRALRKGVHGGPILEPSESYASPEVVVRHARQRDVTFVPVPEPIGLDALYTESIIFDSGRPVILLPAAPGVQRRPHAFANVVVAWDGSRAAARALGDAMPILAMADSIRVVTVPERPGIACPIEDLTRHLAMHEVRAAVERLEASHKSIGSILADCCGDQDLLVMGAFGHSRMREFVLGGATAFMVRNPPLPVFLSH